MGDGGVAISACSRLSKMTVAAVNEAVAISVAAAMRMLLAAPLPLLPRETVAADAGGAVAEPADAPSSFERH